MSLSRTWTICAVREAAGASMPSLIIRMWSEGEVTEVYSLAHLARGSVALLTQKSFRAYTPRPGHTTRGVTASVTRRPTSVTYGGLKASHRRRKRHTVDDMRHTAD